MLQRSNLHSRWNLAAADLNAREAAPSKSAVTTDKEQQAFISSAGVLEMPEVCDS